MDDPMMREKGDMELEFERTAFENQVIVRSMQASLKDFNKNQVSYDVSGGRAVVCIANKELFEAGKNELSDIGKSLIRRLAVSLEGSNPVYYRIAGVTEKANKASLDQASERASSVLDQLGAEQGSVRMPISVGASSCENAAGTTGIGCDRIELIFEQNYENIMGRLEATMAK